MRKRKNTAPLSPEDKQFFITFYDNYVKFIFYIAHKYTAKQEDCEDLVQESLIRLLNNISTLKELNCCKTRSYIVLTVRTAYIDWEKSKSGVTNISLNDEVLETLMSSGQIPATEMDDLSAHWEVEYLKSSLPARDWLALEGKYLLGYSQEELAPLVGVAPDSIRMILCRARSKAREILNRKRYHGGKSND